MATSTSQKTPCATCGKIAGLFTCRGCQKDFCKRHVTEHQQELSRQLDELTIDHDQFRQSLTEQNHQQSHHYPLMKQIDEWELHSINKIRHVANEIRKELQNLINQHTIELNESLNKIAQELRKARDDDDFYEIDLKQWIEKLSKLKKDLIQSTNVNIKQEDNNRMPFISKITLSILSKENFGRLIGNIRIEDNGQAIVKGQPNGYATVRGYGEYSSGQHRFRLKIEVNGSNKWLFIGIISKEVPIQQNSYSCLSVCGWAGDNQVWFDGEHRPGFNGYQSDVEKNDIVELLVNCDQRIIRLTNERTNSSFELEIDPNRSPFPWQLNFNLHYGNDRVTIL